MSRGFVVIDPGHGGSDSGAVNLSTFELYESDINLAICHKLHDMLLVRDYQVTLTREADVYVPVSNRLRMVNQLRPDAFVSVHCNSSDNSSAHGTEVIYRDQFDRLLAECVYDSMIERLKTRGRGVKNDIEVLKRKLMVLSNAPVPSCLVEVAFISNAKDVTVLLDTENVAGSIADGIDAWFANPIR